MDSRFNNTKNLHSSKPYEYDRELQLLRNMESVHTRKKAAFEELLRYTCNNVRTSDIDNNDNDKI